MEPDLIIRRLHAWEVLDSRGTPTIEVEVTLASGATGRAAAPAGASTGSREAAELRDGEAARYCGKGVRRAVAQATTVVGPALVGMTPASRPPWIAGCSSSTAPRPRAGSAPTRCSPPRWRWRGRQRRGAASRCSARCAPAPGPVCPSPC
jgi:hypothetical protein